MEYVEAWPIKVNPSKGGVGEEYLSKFPTGKVPALERPNGYTLFECIPVAVYRKLLIVTYAGRDLAIPVLEAAVCLSDNGSQSQSRTQIRLSWARH